MEALTLLGDNPKNFAGRKEAEKGKTVATKLKDSCIKIAYREKAWEKKK
jgi:hypothetical protein